MVLINVPVRPPNLRRSIPEYKSDNILRIAVPQPIRLLQFDFPAWRVEA